MIFKFIVGIFWLAVGCILGGVAIIVAALAAGITNDLTHNNIATSVAAAVPILSYIAYVIYWIRERRDFAKWLKERDNSDDSDYARFAMPETYSAGEPKEVPQRTARTILRYRVCEVTPINLLNRTPAPHPNIQQAIQSAKQMKSRDPSKTFAIVETEYRNHTYYDGGVVSTI